MIASLDPGSVVAGGSIEVEGKFFDPATVVLVSGLPTTFFTASVGSATELTIQVDPSTPTGSYLVSLQNPDGAESNIVPIQVN